MYTISFNNQQIGPADVGTIKQWKIEGKLDDRAYIWINNEWKPLSDPLLQSLEPGAPPVQYGSAAPLPQPSAEEYSDSKEAFKWPQHMPGETEEEYVARVVKAQAAHTAQAATTPAAAPPPADVGWKPLQTMAPQSFTGGYTYEKYAEKATQTEIHPAEYYAQLAREAWNVEVHSKALHFFQQADKNKDGQLSRAEFEAGIDALGVIKPDRAVFESFLHGKPKHSPGLTQDEFVFFALNRCPDVFGPPPQVVQRFSPPRLVLATQQRLFGSSVQVHPGSGVISSTRSTPMSSLMFRCQAVLSCVAVWIIYGLYRDEECDQPLDTWLLVMGIASLIQALYVVFFSPMVDRHTQEKRLAAARGQNPPRPALTIVCGIRLFGLLSLFSFIWIIVGNVWAFQMKTNLLPAATGSCGETLGFSLQVLFVIYWALTGIMCACGCGMLCCGTFLFAGFAAGRDPGNW